MTSVKVFSNFPVAFFENGILTQTEWELPENRQKAQFLDLLRMMEANCRNMAAGICWPHTDEQYISFEFDRQYRWALELLEKRRNSLQRDYGKEVQVMAFDVTIGGQKGRALRIRTEKVTISVSITTEPSRMVIPDTAHVYEPSFSEWAKNRHMYAS